MEKVIWSEGLFLRPQHFQQQDRYIDHQIRRRFELLAPFLWGFHRLELDQALLRAGKVALIQAEGLLPDGTLFRFPVEGMPPLVFDLGDGEPDTLCLAVPARVRDALESHETDDDRLHARYRILVREIPNSHGTDMRQGNGASAPVALGCLRARLVLQRHLTERDLALPLCRILERGADGGVRLDPEFCPPLLNIAAAPELVRQVAVVIGLAQNRARTLAQRLGGVPGEVSSVADLLLLQALNRHIGLLGLDLARPEPHPYDLFRALAALHGDLATLCRESRLPEALPSYDHSCPARSLGILLGELRALLTRVSEQPALSLPLNRRQFGLTLVPLTDFGLLRSHEFILALKADMPADQLARLVPARVKVGSLGRIRDIVNLQLAGLGLTHLTTVPRQLPYHLGFSYFKVDLRGEAPGDVEQSGGFAIHVSGDIAGLEMEFWALRR